MEVDLNRQIKNKLNIKMLIQDQNTSLCPLRSAAVLRGEHPGLLLQILSHCAVPSREARTPTSLPSLSPSLQPSPLFPSLASLLVSVPAPVPVLGNWQAAAAALKGGNNGRGAAFL